jgi:hypothetical protein
VEAHLAGPDVEDVRDRPVGVVVLGMSLSSRRTGVRPTWTHQTATWRSRPGQGDVTVSGLAVATLDPADRPGPHVVVRVGVLLVPSASIVWWK